MANDTEIPSNKIIRFPTPRRSNAAANRGVGPATAGFGNSYDRGPSTEESLRLMRAFVGIKDRELRADLITMLEGASRRRGSVPARGKD